MHFGGDDNELPPLNAIHPVLKAVYERALERATSLDGEEHLELVQSLLSLCRRLLVRATRGGSYRAMKCMRLALNTLWLELEGSRKLPEEAVEDALMTFLTFLSSDELCTAHGGSAAIRAINMLLSEVVQRAQPAVCALCLLRIIRVTGGGKADARTSEVSLGALACRALTRVTKHLPEKEVDDLTAEALLPLLVEANELIDGGYENENASLVLQSVCAFFSGVSHLFPDALNEALAELPVEAPLEKLTRF